jgi:hypothetical protein
MQYEFNVKTKFKIRDKVEVINHPLYSGFKGEIRGFSIYIDATTDKYDGRIASSAELEIGYDVYGPSSRIFILETKLQHEEQQD